MTNVEICIPDIERCVQRGIVDKTFSAAAVIGSVGDKVFHRAASGTFVTPPPIKKIGLDAVFDLASLTKPLGTTAACLLMSSTNRLGLGVSISKILPEFKDPRFDKVTVDMLLDHTSGFPATADLYLHPASEFKKIVAQIPFENPPGTKTIYSDIGFIVLGWIVEVVARKSLDTFLETEIYKPLGLKDDLFFVRLDKPRIKRPFVATENCPWRKKLLQGEVHDRNAWAMGGVAGHAGLFGTVDGVWTLCQHLLASYKGQSRQFHTGTVMKFWTRTRRLAETTRTLGWDMPTMNNSMAGRRFSRTTVGHLGFTGTSVWIDLSTQVIGVVLTNSAHPTPDGKSAAMSKFRPRIYDLIGGFGDAALSARR